MHVENYTTKITILIIINILKCIDRIEKNYYFIRKNDLSKLLFYKKKLHERIISILSKNLLSLVSKRLAWNFLTFKRVYESSNVIMGVLGLSYFYHVILIENLLYTHTRERTIFYFDIMRENLFPNFLFSTYCIF